MITTYSGLLGLARTGDWLVLDTETTGIFDAQVVQIGLLSANGERLMDTLVRPTIRIPADAQAIHGISDAMVVDAPSFADLHDELRSLVKGRNVLIYNAEYDLKVLNNSSVAHRLPPIWLQAAGNWACVMKAYAQYRGEPGKRPGDFRWHKLGDACRQMQVPLTDAHSAIGDCISTAGIVNALISRSGA